MTDIKNKYVLWNRTKKLAVLDVNPFDEESITLAENSLQSAIMEQFKAYNLKELQVIRYDEKGNGEMEVVPNPHYKDTFVFSADVNVLGIFNDMDIARQKMIDWFTYHYSKEFEHDEIEVIVDELISSSDFAIDDDIYQFCAYTMNKC